MKFEYECEVLFALILIYIYIYPNLNNIQNIKINDVAIFHMQIYVGIISYYTKKKYNNYMNHKLY